MKNTKRQKENSTGCPVKRMVRPLVFLVGGVSLIAEMLNRIQHSGFSVWRTGFDLAPCGEGVGVCVYFREKNAMLFGGRDKLIRLANEIGVSLWPDVGIGHNFLHSQKPLLTSAPEQRVVGSEFHKVLNDDERPNDKAEPPRPTSAVDSGKNK